MTALCEVHGDYRNIVRATRVSYGSADTRTFDADLKLLKYLLTHNHMSPFEMVSLVFKVECPLFVARQFYRHRTLKTYGDDETIMVSEDTVASFNEYSMRYKEGLDISWYIPDQFCKQATTNKQQSSEPIEFDLNCSYQSLVSELYNSIYDLYEEMIASGISREQARIILPQGAYTQFITTMNLRHFIDFCVLRLDEDSQKECKDLALLMLKELKKESILYDLVKFGIGVRSPELVKDL